MGAHASRHDPHVIVAVENLDPLLVEEAASLACARVHFLRSDQLGNKPYPANAVIADHEVSRWVAQQITNGLIPPETTVFCVHPESEYEPQTDPKGVHHCSLRDLVNVIQSAHFA